MRKKPLLIITGPTAAGKTNISIQLAKALQGEIISADSCQVYRGMNIGSAKITVEQMEGVPHHLIDVLDPNEPCNVAKFQEMAYACMDGIYKRGNLPIIVGGTGFYIQSILYGISFEQEEADSLREQIEAYYREQGEANLWNRLEACDPVSAAAIHPNNVKRVIRAIEYYERTGTCISDHNAKEREKEPIYQGLYLVLTNERALLYETINERVDQMVSMGLFQEVERLLKKGYTKDMTSMQAIGYKEIIAYYEGNLTKDEAIDLIKQHTRHFAKRQMTWFRRERNVYMIDKSHYESEQEIVLAILDKWSKEYELL